MSKKINRDHAKKKNHPLIENDAIVSHLSDLLTPLIFSATGSVLQGDRQRLVGLSESTRGEKTY